MTVSSPPPPGSTSATSPRPPSSLAVPSGCREGGRAAGGGNVNHLVDDRSVVGHDEGRLARRHPDRHRAQRELLRLAHEDRHLGGSGRRIVAAVVAPAAGVVCSGQGGRGRRSGGALAESSPQPATASDSAASAAGAPARIEDRVACLSLLASDPMFTVRIKPPQACGPGLAGTSGPCPSPLRLPRRPGPSVSTAARWISSACFRGVSGVVARKGLCESRSPDSNRGPAAYKAAALTS